MKIDTMMEELVSWMKTTGVMEECFYGIDLTLRMENSPNPDSGGRLVFIIDGFYKSNCIKLFVDGNALIAEDRYGEHTPIESFDDLVLLNFEWWERSKDRSGVWEKPDSLWVPHMIRLGLIEEKQVTVYLPK